jgi:hypothetical protein
MHNAPTPASLSLEWTRENDSERIGVQGLVIGLDVEFEAFGRGLDRILELVLVPGYV